MYKGLPLQSNRWDMVIKVTADSPLSATPFFDLLGFKVMASWPGSEKACPRCKTVGHDSHSCPRRPTPKKSKKRNSPSSQRTRTTPATPTSSKIADTADTAVEATPISDPTDEASMDTSSDSAFPFELTDEQVQNLNALTADEWLQHCQNVWTNAPRTHPEIDQFLSLPIAKIVEIFRAEVHRLASSLSSSPATLPPSTSTLPTPNPSTPTPQYPLSLSRVELDRYSGFSDAQFLPEAKSLKKTLPTRKTNETKAFLKHPAETIAASLKQAVIRHRPLKPQT